MSLNSNKVSLHTLLHSSEVIKQREKKPPIVAPRRKRLSRRRRIKSKYYGVYFDSGKWATQVSGIRVGAFYDEDEAARAYDRFLFLTNGNKKKQLLFNFTPMVEENDCEPFTNECVAAAVEIFDNLSKYVGVIFKRNGYFARFTNKNSQIHIGPFEEASEAACAYNLATKMVRSDTYVPVLNVDASLFLKDCEPRTVEMVQAVISKLKDAPNTHEDN